jgi:hypothetical protein
MIESDYEMSVPEVLVDHDGDSVLFEETLKWTIYSRPEQCLLSVPIQVMETMLPSIIDTSTAVDHNFG